MIKQLKEGIGLYKILQGEMEKVLGLQEYVTRMQEINEVMGSVRDLLNEKERGIADLLVQAYELTHVGLEKAVIVVSIIKVQCSTLICVLKTLPETSKKDKKDKLHAACLYFAKFAEKIEKDVKEAEDKLLQASLKTVEAKTQLATNISVLKKIQDEFLEKAKQSKVKQSVQTVTMGTATVGLAIAKKWEKPGFIIACGAAATLGFMALNIFMIRSNFESQRNTIGKYIDEFDNMKEETEKLQKSLETKRNGLLEIHANLEAGESMAKNSWDAIECIADLHFENVRNGVEKVFKACQNFLDHKPPLD